MVGNDAMLIRGTKPTMVLSLNGHPTNIQRSLVIHEFGHALGLEHEHQRSDFWDVLGKHFDMEKMLNDSRLQQSKQKSDPKAKMAAFGKDWLKIHEESGIKSEYDPLSIMHYWWVTHIFSISCTFSIAAKIVNLG